MKPVNLALIGATGMVGQTTLKILEEWNIPIFKLSLFASSGSTGRQVRVGDKEYPVQAISDDLEAEFAIMALSSELSRELAPKLIARGIRVIDHSSAHRMEENVPLVIPEINSDAIQSNCRLVANPNCSASVVLMSLAPLTRSYNLRKVIISTYQSVSGAGSAACDELRAQMQGSPDSRSVFPHRISGNLFPEIGGFEPTNYTGEESKISNEIRKILRLPDLHVSATAVRVPVEIGHCAAVSVELDRHTNLEEANSAFENFNGLKSDGAYYSTPAQIAGEQDVRVGRIRVDPQDGKWLHFWVAGDNTRKGAASNAIQILQYWADL